jgi:D-alanine-D-alanine ligase-like ATP-grasp enzyme
MIKVGVIRGGTGENYSGSLERGGALILNIQDNLSEKFKPVDILIDRDGVWHAGGMPIAPADLNHRVDIIWNASDPEWKKVLENIYIPHISTGHLASSLADSRENLAKYLKANEMEVKMPRHIILPTYQADFDGGEERYAVKKAMEIFEKFAGPWIVKSFTGDTDTGVRVAKTYPELISAITEFASRGKSILVEELIAGKEVSMHTLSGFRGEEAYTFPIGHGSTQEKETLSNLTKKIHDIIGMPNYLKTDFILSPRGNIYLSNVSFHPDLNADSHFGQVCLSVGATTHQAFEHMLNFALNKKWT